MCGIAGIWFKTGRTADALTSTADAIGSALRHRGPDAGKSWTDGSNQLLLIHRRLSILDLTEAGAQPMTSTDGRFVIVYNGECYNFQELRDRLCKEGCQFKGHSDTEVILEGCARWGIERIVPELNGMFAIAVWDKKERTLALARDPVGIKPLYYGWVDENFVFGSELKAFRLVPGFRGAVDRNSLGQFLRYSYIPAPHSIFEGIRKLPPGHLLWVRNPAEHPEPKQFWSPKPFITGSRRRYTESSDAVDALDELLRDAVSKQMISDVPLGAFLSGGVDSSTVVAMMQAQSHNPIRTFSIGFEEAAFNESRYAAAVAVHLKTEHRELVVTAKAALDLIPKLPQMFDEPLADASAIPTYFVSQLARQNVTVSLSGDGGDELFMGYDHCQQAWRRTQRILGVPQALRKLGGAALSAMGLLSSNFKLSKYGAVLKQDTATSIYRAMASHWFDPGEVVIGLTASSAIAGEDAIGNSLDAVTDWDFCNYLPEDVLTKVDRASMAVSLESRVPLLDQRIVEFGLSLPVDLKICQGQNKWILRQVLHRYVPPSLIDRPKQGFTVPLGEWLRGPLRDWAEELISAKRLGDEGFLRQRVIRQKWNEHLSGQRNWDELLWSVLMFQAWRQHWGRC
jgi:asparagine synthase (glutamine-hydrolysing)